MSRMGRCLCSAVVEQVVVYSQHGPAYRRVDIPNALERLGVADNLAGLIIFALVAEVEKRYLPALCGTKSDIPTRAVPSGMKSTHSCEAV